MVTIQANKVSLDYLTDKFNLEWTNDEQFFSEWLLDLPELSNSEKEALDRIQKNYLYLNNKQPLIEDIVKMVVVSNLLDLAGFYEPPFYLKGEPSIEVSVEDEDEILTGNIDILVLCDRFWLLVIESKRSAFSLQLGRQQALAYMLGNPDQITQPTFGLITNGSNFIFIKLVKENSSLKYAYSDEFSLFKRENELYKVLSILKRLGTLSLQ